MRYASGRGMSRTVISTAMPNRPSEPTNSPVRSGPTSSTLSPPSRTTSPSGSTTSKPSTWFAVIPWRKQWAPPELKATLPPIVHTDWLEGSGA